MNRGPLTPPPPSLKNVKFFIYGVMWLKLEKNNIFMFANTLVHHNVSFVK